MKTAALFHNVRSAYNVGALLRTADGAGVSHVYLTGVTPSPTDRFGRPQRAIVKTALGAERSVAWSYAKSPTEIIEKLRKERWRIVGVEQDTKAIDYRTLTRAKPTLFIFGAEVKGLSPAIRKKCDT